MFTTPLGLWALLGVPLVLALHYFRRRFTPREVSALFLWGEVDPVAAAGRRRERLLHTPTLWCELVAALALGLALGGPRACGTRPAEHLVVVLDNSASMAAAAPGDASSTDRARAFLDERVEDLPAGSRVSLVLSGAEPKLLAGPLALPEEARASLAAWQPTLGSHTFGEALGLGAELAGAGRVVFLTDTPPVNELGPTVEWHAFGRPLDNLGFETVRRSAAALELTVHNFARRPRTADLRVFQLDPNTGRQQLELARASFEVPARGTTVHRVDLTGERFEGALLRATLEPDALALDNEVVVAPPPARTLTLGSSFNAEVAQALGLTHSSSSAAPHLDRIVTAVPNARVSADPAEADVWFGAAPPGDRAWNLAVVNAAAGQRAFAAPFLVARGDPLAAGLALQGVVWSASDAIALAGRPLVSAGDVALLAIDGTTLTLNLDPARSTLTTAPDWPILISNFAEARRRALPGAPRTNLRLGEDLALSAEGTTRYTLTARFPRTGFTAEAPRSATTRLGLVWETPTAPGLYTLETERVAEASAARREWLAFNALSGAESDLVALGEGLFLPEIASAAADTEENPATTALLLLGIAALLLDGLFVTGVLGARRRGLSSGGA